MVPKFIYKYVRIDDYLFLNLKNHQLWLSNPNDFNDPFDCNICWEQDHPPHTLLQFIEKEIGFNNWSQKEKEENIKLCETFPVLVYTRIVNEFKNRMFNSGICCFSTEEMNLLLWSHYANCHRGACLQFETKTLMKIFPTINKIKYTSKFPEVNPFIDLKHAIEIVPFYKSHHWKYEKEVRIVMETSGAYEFPPEALTGITFGAKSHIDDRYNVLECLEKGDYNYKKMYGRTLCIHDKLYELYPCVKH